MLRIMVNQDGRDLATGTTVRANSQIKLAAEQLLLQFRILPGVNYLVDFSHIVRSTLWTLNLSTH
jgi:hypothetical protein